MEYVWTVDGGRLGGRPGPQHAMWDLERLKRAGFTAVVSLECADPHLDTVREAGMRHLRLCVEDFTAPTVDQLVEFNRFVDGELEEGGRVLAHCYAGIGRTGTVLASRLIWNGLSVEEAVRTVRGREPRAIQTRDQMAVLHHFVRYLADRP